MLMNAKEWEYSNEGKTKLVLVYTGSNKYYHGKALILRKSRITDMESCFHHEVMGRILTFLYVVDKSETVHCAAEFLEDLLEQLQYCRPIGRACGKSLELYHNAELQPNCCGLQGQFSDFLRATSASCISVEIKVKCGLKASSPFIPESRRVKFFYSRFQLMQCYKYSKAKKTSDGILSWGKFVSKSAYMPEDLCSSDIHRIAHSLRMLLATPQNNMRICIDGRHAYGWDKVEDKHFRDCLSASATALCFDPTKDPSEQLVNLVAGILANESILDRLVVAQDLDVLDVEGSAIVYKRVVLLCGGSESVAQSFLHTAFDKPIDERLLSRHTDGKCNNLGDSNLETVLKLRQLRVSHDTPIEIRDNYRTAAKNIISIASMDTCALLLQLFMVSLVAKDASVIITMKRCDPVIADVLPFVSVPQNLQNCGVFVTPTHNSDTRNCTNTPDTDIYAYSVRAIDVGLKSLDKLWRKEDEEDEVCMAAAKRYIDIY